MSKFINLEGNGDRNYFQLSIRTTCRGNKFVLCKVRHTIDETYNIDQLKTIINLSGAATIEVFPELIDIVTSLGYTLDEQLL